MRRGEESREEDMREGREEEEKIGDFNLNVKSFKKIYY